MKITILIILFFFFNRLSAQPGCTDPQALNYDANANENDGSCIYPITNYELSQICELPETLEECSGSELINSGLWIHNDGGNEHKIYRIDSLNGNILQTVTVGNAENIDWEDFAENENYLFLGDFGNNIGNRTDLRIYRINKNELSNNTLDAELIEFEYSDQIDFSKNNQNHNFDCEAFIYYNDQLHLFSKNWLDNKTKHYVLSSEPGVHIAQLEETFNVGGLITGADFNGDNEIVLLGYTELGFNFMWLLFDFNEDDLFSGNKRKISLGTGLTNSQTEGITFRENGYGYIVSEKFNFNKQITLPQKMLSFSINQWLGATVSTTNKYPLKSVSVFPNPSQGAFEIQNNKQKKLDWQLYNEIGQFIKSGKTTGLKTKIDTNGFPAGIYYLFVFNDNDRRSFKLIKE